MIDLAKALDKTKNPKARAILRERLGSEMKAANPYLIGPRDTSLLPAPNVEDA
jgi:hypothetical protein